MPSVESRTALSHEAILARENATDSITKWTPCFSSEQVLANNIELYKGEILNSEWNCLKCNITINNSARVVADILNAPDLVSQYDEMTKSCEVIDPIHNIRHVKAVAVFPTAPRDFVVITSETVLERSGEIVIASKSVEHEDVPPLSGFVRGTVLMSGYILRPMSENQCKLTVICHLDLAGYVPSSLINALGKSSVVKLVCNVKEMAEELPKPIASMNLTCEPEFTPLNHEELLARESGSDGKTMWSVMSSGNDEMKLYRGVVEGSEWNSLKVICTIDATPRTVADVVNDPKMVPKYDEMTDKCIVIYDLGDQRSSIRHVLSKAIFPAAARDFSVISSETCLENEQTIVISSKSIEHKNIPEGNGYVRGKVIMSGYVLRLLPESMCEATMICHLDLGGYLPSSLINTFSRSAPIKLIGKVKKIAEELPKSPPVSTNSTPIGQNVSHLKSDIELGGLNYEELLARESGSDNKTTWYTLSGKNDEIQLSRGIISDSDWHSLKAISIIDAPPPVLAELLMDSEMVPKFDEMTEECCLIQELSKTSSIRHVKSRGIFPTSPRDFVVITSESYLEKEDTIIISSKSIKDSDIPEKHGYVRGTVLMSGYILRPLPEDQCLLTIICHLDLAGYLPSSLINAVSRTAPIKMMTRIKQLIEIKL